MTGKSLGKGIGALIPEYSEPTGDTPQIAELLIDRIISNPAQPRHDFDEKLLEELAASIRENGIVQPVTVRKSGDGYQIIAGERRLRAVRLLSLRTIPAYVIDTDDEESSLQLALIENVQREDLNPIDEATAYRELTDKFNLTHAEVAQRVGKDRSTIANMLRLLSLPEEIQQALRGGALSPGHARALLALREPARIKRLFARIIKEGLSVRAVEDIVRDGAELSKPELKQVQLRKPKSPQIRAVEEDLMARLGTKVRLKEKKNGGELIVEYYSAEDLERLLELFGMIEL